jgi:hypothetical protein
MSWDDWFMVSAIALILVNTALDAWLAERRRLGALYRGWP